MLTSYGDTLMSKTLLHPVQTPTLAAFITGQAIAPLWVSPSGRAFYPIAGGSPDDDKPADKPADKPEDKPADKPEDKKFEPVTSQEEFDRRLAARLQREREKFADYEELKKVKAEHDKIVEAAKTEQEKAVDAARKEGESSALERANKLLVRAKAETMAAQANFAAPEAVVATLNLSGVKVDDDGKIDTGALKVLIDAAAESGAFVIGDGKSRPKPDKSQGGGGGGAETPSVSRGADLFAERRGKKSASAAS